jgi:chromate reductase, NAD(P)H dehydrogenase (quinone)
MIKFSVLIVAFCLQIGVLFADMHVLAVAGSTREDSLNRKLLAEAVQLLEARGASVTLFDLKKSPMPFYDGDLEREEGMPENAKSFRRLMMESDLIVFASPDYNGSLSAILKNAIDWASRSEEAGRSKEAFLSKHILLMSASPGKSGGAHALAHLRIILSHLGANVDLEQMTLPKAHERLGRKDDLYKKELSDLIDHVLMPHLVIH